MNKKFLLSAFLTAIMISGLVLASATRFGTVQASTDVSGIPKPSVPEFTLRYIDLSYDVPPTYGTDQFTGKSIITEEGYHVDKRTIEFTIKNQPFTSYVDASGNNISLYYYFRYKGPYGDDWSYYPDSSHTYGPYSGGPFPDTSASNSEYTIIGVNLPTLEIPTDSQVEFQVQAIMGYVEGHSTGMLAGSYMGFRGERSDWSNTQTITIGESQTPTPSPATTPTPTPPPAPTPIPVPGQSFFFVESNSTVSELFFNSTSSELSFTVSGTSETAGYVKVTIAKSLVSSVQNVKVYLDGDELDVAITSDEDSWLLSFNYVHSTHHVKISLATEAATTFLGIEFWIGICVAIIVILIGVVLLVYFKKRKH